VSAKPYCFRIFLFWHSPLAHASAQCSPTSSPTRAGKLAITWSSLSNSLARSFNEPHMTSVQATIRQRSQKEGPVSESKTVGAQRPGSHPFALSLDPFVVALSIEQAKALSRDKDAPNTPYTGASDPRELCDPAKPLETGCAALVWTASELPYRVGRITSKPQAVSETVTIRPTDGTLKRACRTDSVCRIVSIQSNI
jgi:hypothetical protein